MRHLKLTLILAALATLVSCRHNREPNKIIDGLPLAVEETVLPAQSLQELLLLKRDNTKLVITVLNKTTISNPAYPELGTPTGNRYPFVMTDSHYGTANGTLEFFDGNGASINPITLQSSTATIKSIAINSTVASPLFNFTESGTLTLDTAGDITSTIRYTGTFAFTGSDFSINYSLVAPGARTTIDGFRDGTLVGTGSRTSTGNAVSMSIGLNNDQSANGPINWDNRHGDVHIENNGIGFVVTNTARIPVN